MELQICCFPIRPYKCSLDCLGIIMYYFVWKVLIMFKGKTLVILPIFLQQIKFEKIIKNSKAKSLARLNSLVKNFKETNKFEASVNINQAQIQEGIVEKLREVCEIKVPES